MFTEELRLGWIQEIYKENHKIDAVVYEGLTISCCQQSERKFYSSRHPLRKRFRI